LDGLHIHTISLDGLVGSSLEQDAPYSTCYENTAEPHQDLRLIMRDDKADGVEKEYLKLFFVDQQDVPKEDTLTLEQLTRSSTCISWVAQQELYSFDGEEVIGPARALLGYEAAVGIRDRLSVLRARQALDQQERNFAERIEGTLSPAELLEPMHKYLISVLTCRACVEDRNSLEATSITERRALALHDDQRATHPYDVVPDPHACIHAGFAGPRAGQQTSKGAKLLMKEICDAWGIRDVAELLPRNRKPEHFGDTLLRSIEKLSRAHISLQSVRNPLREKIAWRLSGPRRHNRSTLILADVDHAVEELLNSPRRF
jgi:hypothetical protein